MGIRGQLPNLKIRSEALKDLNPPEWLGSVAREFYAKHAPQLKDNLLLTESTADSFAILCDLWERVQTFRGEATTRSYLDAMKAFTSLAKNFRLIPVEKPSVKEDRFMDFGEIDV